MKKVWIIENFESYEDGSRLDVCDTEERARAILDVFLKSRDWKAIPINKDWELETVVGCWICKGAECMKLHECRIIVG